MFSVKSWLTRTQRLEEFCFFEEMKFAKNGKGALDGPKRQVTSDEDGVRDITMKDGGIQLRMLGSSSRVLEYFLELSVQSF